MQTINDILVLYIAGFLIYFLLTYKRIYELVEYKKYLKSKGLHAPIIIIFIIFYFVGFIAWWNYAYIDLKQIISKL